MSATSYKYGVEVPPQLPEPTIETTVEPAAATIEIAAPETSGLATTHTVVSGDTLGSIALEHYGKSSKWRLIRDANTETLGGGIKLSLGMELTVPALAE